MIEFRSTFLLKNVIVPFIKLVRMNIPNGFDFISMCCMCLN